jgi:hypothetical protein
MEPHGQSPWYLGQRPRGATFPVMRWEVTRWLIPPRPKAVPARRSACVRRNTPCSPVFRHAGVVSCCRNVKWPVVHLCTISWLLPFENAVSVNRRPSRNTAFQRKKYGFYPIYSMANSLVFIDKNHRTTTNIFFAADPLMFSSD